MYCHNQKDTKGEKFLTSGYHMYNGVYGSTLVIDMQRQEFLGKS